jgi:HD-GYP domain-containing protein (c-di-GMP phosphodiesterase class II)
MDGISPRISRNRSHGVQIGELLGALSRALDLGEGRAEGHTLRACWIGVQFGHALGVAGTELRELYLLMLAKDLGASAIAPWISERYQACDLDFKRELRRADGRPTECLRRAVRAARHRAQPPLRRFLNGLRVRDDDALELFAERAGRGADFARRLGLPEAVAHGILCFGERWDGGGLPFGLRGLSIPIAARIAQLAEIAVSAFATGGADAARHDVRRRSGTALDPQLVAAFDQLAATPHFWAGAAAPDLDRRIAALDPADSLDSTARGGRLDADHLDEIATVFGEITDAKSRFTAGHSGRVAARATRLAEMIGIVPERRRLLKRAALLHDLGKLGVSSLILDKPGALDAVESHAVRPHPEEVAAILARIEPLAESGRIAAAHHERLDSTGYPFGLCASEIGIESRVLAVVDIFDALTAKRPQRDALPVARALEILTASAGQVVDPDCVEALAASLRED